MKKLLYICSVPIFAVSLGFVKPVVDWSPNGDTQQKGTKPKEKIESPKTRKGFQKFKKGIRERYNHRRVAQYYVNSWFITSFNLDLDDNTFLISETEDPNVLGSISAK